MRSNDWKWRYGLAVVAAAVALGVRILLTPVLHSAVPYSTAFLAAIVVGSFVGAGPSLVTSVLTGVGLLYYVVPPAYSLVPATREDRAAFFFYLVLSALITLISSQLTRERKRAQDAEKAERNQRNWWFSTLASIGDAVIATDAAGRVQFCNAVAERLTGWTTEAAKDQQIEAIFNIQSPDGAPLVENPIRQALESGHVHQLNVEAVLVSRDGHRFPIADSVAPIRDREGATFGAVLVFRDITERKEAERTLHAHAENLRLALQASRMGTWNRNLITGEVRWSPELERLFGLEAGTFRGTRAEFLELIHPDDRPAYERTIQRAVEARTDYALEFRFIHRSGEVRWMEGRGRAFYDESGTPTHLAGIGMDIHERKLVEQKLLQINSELEQFAYAASHDLREPLRMISMYVQFLDRRYGHLLDEDGKQFIAYARDGASRMSQLIHALLAYSQASRPELLQKRLVASAQALSAAMANLAAAIRDSGAIVTSSELPTVFGNEVHLTQLFQNLIENSIKYRRPGVTPEIRVEHRTSATQDVFLVSDNGMGIESEHLEKIFGVFQRLHGREVSGAGIGLATCRKIVEQYGGRIWVESTVGQGSTFYFSLERTMTGERRVAKGAAESHFG